MHHTFESMCYAIPDGFAASCVWLYKLLSQNTLRGLNRTIVHPGVYVDNFSVSAMRRSAAVFRRIQTDPSIPRCSKEVTGEGSCVEIKTMWPPDDTTQRSARALLLK